MIGKVIRDNYKIMDEIGRGSAATVYLAKDTARNQVVALKIIHPDLDREGEFLRRFRREARLLARLDTPHAVRVFDYGEEDGLNFIVLEYVQGADLSQLSASGALGSPHSRQPRYRTCLSPSTICSSCHRTRKRQSRQRHLL